MTVTQTFKLKPTFLELTKERKINKGEDHMQILYGVVNFLKTRWCTRKPKYIR